MPKNLLRVSSQRFISKNLGLSASESLSIVSIEGDTVNNTSNRAGTTAKTSINSENNMLFKYRTTAGKSGIIKVECREETGDKLRVVETTLGGRPIVRVRDKRDLIFQYHASPELAQEHLDRLQLLKPKHAARRYQKYWIALALTVVFGPFGLLYIGWKTTLATLAFGFFCVVTESKDMRPFLWVVSMLVAMASVAINNWLAAIEEAKTPNPLGGQHDPATIDQDK